MNGTSAVVRGPGQSVETEEKVLFGANTDRTLIAATNDVQQNIRDTQAGATGHRVLSSEPNGFRTA